VSILDKFALKIDKIDMDNLNGMKEVAKKISSIKDKDIINTIIDSFDNVKKSKGVGKNGKNV
jgi:hypothetical protein